MVHHVYTAISKRKSRKKKQHENYSRNQRTKSNSTTEYCKGRQTATRQMLKTTSLLFSNAIPDGKGSVITGLTQFLVHFC